MGKKRPIVVVSSSDDDEKASRDRSSSRSRPRSRSAASVKSSRRKGSSKKLNAGISRARSFDLSDEAAKFDKLSEDFDDCLHNFNVVSGLKSTNTKMVWVDMYKPRSLEELAVHKKKVDEVKQWLEERLMTSEEGFGNSTLLISGQAGVGKSATIHVIASELGFELCEWTTPTPTLWKEHVHNSNAGRHYMSKLDEFEAFVEKVGKYCLLPTSHTRGARKPIMVLIDDLPVTNGRIAFARLCKCLTTLVRSSQIPTVILITEYHKTESAYSSTNYSEELQSTLEKAGAHKVMFNPLTVNSIKKSLFRICEKEKCDVTAELIDHVSRASGGDIRHALTSLQYLCLRPVDTFTFPLWTLPAIHVETSVDKRNSLSSSIPAGSEDINTRASFSLGRDETLTLFHALGKFLHNKRDETNMYAHGPDSLVLRENLSRNPLKMDAPETVLSQAHGQARNIADFLHENVLDFISDEAIDDAWLVASYLCDTDFLLGSALRPTRIHMMSETTEPEDLAQSVAASVAARGVLFGNSHPSPSRWHTIRSPRGWQIEQLSQHNKNQMAMERFEDLNNNISFEYGSTIKWLRSKTSCIQPTLPENLSQNKKGENNHDCGSMYEVNEGIYSEDIEEDDIEDW